VIYQRLTVILQSDKNLSVSVQWKNSNWNKAETNK